MAEILFYILGALAIATSIGVVLAKSPMMSVISLLGSFFCVAVIYLLAGFQFLAAVQILVYAGAILVLFLFVVMLLNLGAIGQAAEAELAYLRGPGAKVATVLAAAIALAGLMAVRGSRGAIREVDPQAAAEGYDGLGPLAGELFGRYALPFEAASVLLLASMVAVLVLAKRRERKEQP